MKKRRKWCFATINLRVEPGDHEARLQLAHLLEMRLKGYDEDAERFVSGDSEARNLRRRPRTSRCAPRTALIDLYRKLGRTGPAAGRAGAVCRALRGALAGGSPLAAGAARRGASKS